LRWRRWTPHSHRASRQPSRAAAKSLKAAEDAIHQKKFDVAAAKIKEVEALPERSPYDEFLVHEMKAFLDFHNKDTPTRKKTWRRISTRRLPNPPRCPAT